MDETPNSKSKSRSKKNPHEGEESTDSTIITLDTLTEFAENLIKNTPNSFASNHESLEKQLEEQIGDKYNKKKNAYRICPACKKTIGAFGSNFKLHVQKCCPLVYNEILRQNENYFAAYEKLKQLNFLQHFKIPSNYVDASQHYKNTKNTTIVIANTPTVPASLGLTSSGSGGANRKSKSNSNTTPFKLESKLNFPSSQLPSSSSQSTQVVPPPSSSSSLPSSSSSMVSHSSTVAHSSIHQDNYLNSSLFPFKLNPANSTPSQNAVASSSTVEVHSYLNSMEKQMLIEDFKSKTSELDSNLYIPTDLLRSLEDVDESKWTYQLKKKSYQRYHFHCNWLQDLFSPFQFENLLEEIMNPSMRMISSLEEEKEEHLSKVTVDTFNVQDYKTDLVEL